MHAHLEHIGSPVVFCHSDLLMNNIVYNKETDRLAFIDYVFAMYNHEHYELGNHFNEYAGVEVLDYSQFPDKAYQLDWLRYYLEQKAKSQGRSQDAVADSDVERCYVLTNKFTLASDLFCGLWALAQTKLSLIDFGYAQKRFEHYLSRKEELLALPVPDN
ncbi:EKI1-like protein [Mya arenaria]|uniref:ethanolamine kinase n=1 Tax=Mya arenaria TaxID=6604 RepID=A0ABY7FQI3_MYAAR|nr:EKI1-like protein [Mya arenaria]